MSPGPGSTFDLLKMVSSELMSNGNPQRKHTACSASTAPCPVGKSIALVKYLSQANWHGGTVALCAQHLHVWRRDGPDIRVVLSWERRGIALPCAEALPGPLQ